MNIIENHGIIGHRRDLVDGMTSYMIDDATNSDTDAAYTQGHIDRCGAILDAYLAGLDADKVSGNPEMIMALVKNAVMALNDLNDECGGNLIETDQRELLCDIIIGWANAAGLITDEDVTEEWREW